MSSAKRKVFPVKNGKTTLGMHMMLDAYGVPKKPLNDMRLVFRFLNSLPAMIGMRVLMTPRVVEPDKNHTSRKDGVSGIVMLYESHISMHTFASKGHFSFDLYSCSDFGEEVGTVVDYVKKLFPWKRHKLQVVKRGLEYPVENVA